MIYPVMRVGIKRAKLAMPGDIVIIRGKPHEVLELVSSTEYLVRRANWWRRFVLWWRGSEMS